jgi:hypothetical protein
MGMVCGAVQGHVLAAPTGPSRSSPATSSPGWNGRAPAAASRTAATSRCSRRPGSGCRSWRRSASTRMTRGAATWTCGTGRSPSAGRAAGPVSSRSATTRPAASTGTSASGPGTPRRTGAGHRRPGWLVLGVADGYDPRQVVGPPRRRRQDRGRHVKPVAAREIPDLPHAWNVLHPSLPASYLSRSPDRRLAGACVRPSGDVGSGGRAVRSLHG